MNFISEYQNIIVAGLTVAFALVMAFLASRFTTKEAHDLLKAEVEGLVKVVDKIEFEFVQVKEAGKKLAEEFARVSQVIFGLEHKVSTLPTDESVQELKHGMVRLEGRIENALEKFEKTDALIVRLERQVDRMDDFLVTRSTT